MKQPKDVLVTTTSTLSNINIVKYLKPVSAHLVAGTGFGSDFLASFTDLVGGRSNSYQKQLTRLYNDAIANLKVAAFEIGANCVLGLSIDMDEISGKGKAMFMLTATGTAVIIEEPAKPVKQSVSGVNLSNDGLELLKKKNNLIKEAREKKLVINSETWDFITDNQVYEVFSYVVDMISATLSKPENMHSNAEEGIQKRLLGYINALPENVRWETLSNRIESEKDPKTETVLFDIANSLQIVDLDKALQLIQSDDFIKRKKGIRLAVSDKAFYNSDDLERFKQLNAIIKSSFPERGSRTVQKSFLSKEKEVWTCECGKINFIDASCSGCKRDIYGFTYAETNPVKAAQLLDEKIELVEEFLQSS